MRSLEIARVKLLPSLHRLSVFARTFFLILAALIIAEGIGVTLLINRPPIHNAPVSLLQVARLLSVDQQQSPAPFTPDHASFDRPPAGPPTGPPGALPDGPPGPPPMRGRLDIFSPGESPERELTVRDVSAAPSAPRDIDKYASGIAQSRLVTLMQIDADAVRVYVRENHDSFPQTGPPNDTALREGFIAARRLADGRWRVVESIAQGFPNAFQRQALWLFAIGLAVLLPLAWLFAKALSAPIRRFSLAAQRLGTDAAAPPLAEEGPAEMLLAVKSFNEMQARLNRLLQERTEMIGAIAHDLRTPLTRLAFRLDDLPSPLNEKVKADIQEMKSMISAALDFIRDRSLSTRRERLDFRLLVESVVDDQSDLGHDVTLQIGAPVTVVGDPLALRRTVMNLVDNAVKFGERARLRVRVDGSRCILEVDDDGPGIVDSQCNRVFEPFFRLESSRNRDTGGVGLGLAVVRATVIDHGGDVTLQTRKEGGLRATVWLPMN